METEPEVIRAALTSAVEIFDLEIPLANDVVIAYDDASN